LDGYSAEWPGRDYYRFGHAKLPKRAKSVNSVLRILLRVAEEEFHSLQKFRHFVMALQMVPGVGLAWLADEDPKVSLGEYSKGIFVAAVVA
jgi:hypothetical protein